MDGLRTTTFSNFEIAWMCNSNFHWPNDANLGCGAMVQMQQSHYLIYSLSVNKISFTQHKIVDDIAFCSSIFFQNTVPMQMLIYTHAHKIDRGA
jgi:hypothetical protein